MKKYLAVIMIMQILFGFVFLNSKVMAAYQGETQIVYTGQFDVNYYKPSDEPKNANKIKDIGNKIIGVLQVIGTGMSVLMLVVIGIKYMLGSVEERAEYKETMKPYLIGAVLVFGITNLLSILNKIVGGLF